MSRNPDARVRRCQRVIRMVCELHRLGYQGLRIMPYFYPLAYRVVIAPADGFSQRNGAYTSASQADYFGWTDARTDTAR